MGNKTCTEVQTELPWLVNGSLCSERQRPLWQHLGECRNCRSDMVEWARLAAGVRAVQANTPAHVLESVWQAICRGAMEDERAGHRVRPISAVFPPLGVVGDVLRWALLRAGQLSDIPPSPFHVSS